MMLSKLKSLTKKASTVCRGDRVGEKVRGFRAEVDVFRVAASRYY